MTAAKRATPSGTPTPAPTLAPISFNLEGEAVGSAGFVPVAGTAEL